jgi:hypothetical protein
MPDGARVIAWHQSQGGQVVDGYLLEKRAGVWVAAVIDEQGALQPASHPACLRCHDMAPTDHLFGPPANRPSTPSVQESNGTERR